MSEARSPGPPGPPAPTSAAGTDPEAAAALAAAEAWLLSRELFGIRPGLDRMRTLLARLGDPQTRFHAIHVVGSNGKTSTVTIASALLERRGISSGAYLSPHLVSFRERVQLAGEPSAPRIFADAVGRVRQAAEALESEGRLADHGVITQFEAVTAAAFLVLADAGVTCAVIEAGLGGRWDATNVLPRGTGGPGAARAVGGSSSGASSASGSADSAGARRPDPAVAVLTSVSLEHTRWLGETVEAIADEKVEVLRPGGTLVIGDGVPDAARQVARRRAAERGARIVQAPADPGAELPTPGAPGYQRRNLATALAAVRAYVGAEVADDHDAEHAVAARLSVPGRFETVDSGADRPTVIHDGAHNRAGIEALVEALDQSTPVRPVVLVVGVLDDKSPAEMLAGLARWADSVVAVTPRNPRSIPADALAAQVREVLPDREVRVIDDAIDAVEQARALAGSRGTVLVTGSLHLVAELRRGRDAAPGSAF